MHTIYLLLGSNLGDRLNYLLQAAEMIRKELGTIKKESSVYETASWGIEDQPQYLNQVLLVESEQQPHEVLQTIQGIEHRLGRTRAEKWGSRTIDIDILFYDQEVISQPDLVIPHPLLHTRRFTLAPLNEIAAYLIHPVLKMQISELFKQLLDNLHVYKFIMKTKVFDVNLAYLNDIAGGSTEFIIDMIDIFIEQTPIYFTQLGEAIQQKEWKATADLAHKIKPTLAFVGADQLKDKMALIESNARKMIDTHTIEADFLEINQTCVLIYEGLARAKQELLSKM